jgi:putative SOS response-associated peptidase YedK
MPVIVEPEDWDAWLDTDNVAVLPALVEKLKAGRSDAEIQSWPVTPKMNTPRFESPECVKPI